MNTLSIVIFVIGFEGEIKMAGVLQTVMDKFFDSIPEKQFEGFSAEKKDKPKKGLGTKPTVVRDVDFDAYEDMMNTEEKTSSVEMIAKHYADIITEESRDPDTGEDRASKVNNNVVYTKGVTTVEDVESQGFYVDKILRDNARDPSNRLGSTSAPINKKEGYYNKIQKLIEEHNKETTFTPYVSSRGVDALEGPEASGPISGPVKKLSEFEKIKLSVYDEFGKYKREFDKAIGAINNSNTEKDLKERGAKTVLKEYVQLRKELDMMGRDRKDFYEKFIAGRQGLGIDPTKLANPVEGLAERLAEARRMIANNEPIGEGLYSNVDFDFIKKQEGFKKELYVPRDPKNKNLALENSGVTVASGFDLGQRNKADLKGLSPTIISKLTPYLGLKRAAAINAVKANPLTLTQSEAEEINTFAKQQETDKLIKKWNATSSTEWDDLTKEQATVVASVGFQYGNLATKTPRFWGFATDGDWDNVSKELRNFKDKYGSRRKREANYLEGTPKRIF